MEVEGQEGHNDVLNVLTWPDNSPNLNPIPDSVQCTGQLIPINRGPAAQFKRLKGSTANISVPDTTAYLWGTKGVYVLSVLELT